MKIWVGFPPGGSADTVARLLAEKMKVALGQNVVVDNKRGAAGRPVLGELKRMPPDGTNLVLSPSGAMVIAPHLYAVLGGHAPAARRGRRTRRPPCRCPAPTASAWCPTTRRGRSWR